MKSSGLKLRFKTHEDILEAAVAEVSLATTVIDKIQTRYDAISAHLDRDDSSIKHLNPYVYPQGSISLGTANQPLNKDDEIDVDIVAELRGGSKDLFTQAALKRKVLAEIEEYARRHNMSRPNNGRRCATLTYRDHSNGGHKFHVDILPAVPDQQAYRVILERAGRAYTDKEIDGAIAITCKEHPNYNQYSDEWPISNPRGYARWFESRQSIVLSEQRANLIKQKVAASVEEIPLYRVNTPLQKVIKLLKRDRDATMGDDEDKPISIIITTLAASAYGGESSLVAALQNILNRMDQYIDRGAGGEYIILNPVNPQENFADRWIDKNKSIRFFEWLRKAQATYKAFLEGPIDQSRSILSKSLTESAFVSIVRQLPIKDGNSDILVQAMTRDAASGSVNTDKLLQLIHFGILGRVDWLTVERFAKQNYDFSTDDEGKDVAKINYYQVARHQNIELSDEAIADVEATMAKHRDSAAFRMCGHLLLGTATKQMIFDCIESGYNGDVLDWPILRLADV